MNKMKDTIKYLDEKDLYKFNESFYVNNIRCHIRFSSYYSDYLKEQKTYCYCTIDNFGTEYNFKQYFDENMSLETFYIEINKVKRKWKLIIEQIISKVELWNEE